VLRKSERMAHHCLSFWVDLLQKIGEPHTGKKEDLIERLVKHDETKARELESLEAEFGNLDEFDDHSKLNLG
jgi:SAP domain-containing ribonucleoprotein